MVKVYLPNFAICTFSLTLNFIALGICPLPAVAQQAILQTNGKQESNDDAINVEPEILAEINRVRTNPQGYAHWLEDQKQYYDQIWLKLPGEKPIRAHRLERAIDEAIAVLKEQKPLPALSSSEQTAANANQKLEDFAGTNKNIQNISYGRITPQGIVMSLVVDELFPDRRRRKSLLSPNVEDTGVVCQNDPRYAKVCAIAYSQPEVDNTAVKQPDTSTSPETETVASQPETPPLIEAETTADKPNIPETIPEAVEKPEAIIENSEDESEVAMETLPQPPKPQVPPAPSELPDVELPTSEAENPVEEDEAEVEVAKADLEEDLASEEFADDSEEGINDEDIEDSEDLEDTNEEDIEDEDELTSEEDKDLGEEEIAENEEIFEAEEGSKDIEEPIAANSDSSRFLENVERGALEDGDRVIAEDGSFYDSYPLDAKSGESFTISLESDEFDAFVALIDSKGNIIEQNDDINEEDSNSRIRVTIPESGTYNVIVNAYDEGGSGQYVLTVNR